jgi:hypothetical protein
MTIMSPIIDYTVLPGFARATAFSGQPTATCPQHSRRGALSDFFQARATALKSRWYVGSGSTARTRQSTK